MNIEILRAVEEWQRAGAYSVRIQGMNRQHHISLREEFDGHDGEGTRYIVLLDDGYPVATCRFYELKPDRVMIGRVVVLPEYRRQGLGTRVVMECEKWAAELGYDSAVLESRDNKVDFYKKLGYAATGEAKDGETFRCIRMEKNLCAVQTG